ncbi:MAG: zinc-ribbon domain-containing protein [Nitrospiraceae bacterium]
MKRCSSCQYQLPEISRFCTQCGKPVNRSSGSRSPLEALGLKSGDLNINVLYAMVAVLILALVFPPWETPPSHAPEFLGLHFILHPPQPDAMVSRLLLTIELTTIAIAGLYLSFLFRKR